MYGRKLGAYRLAELIGAGGMGEVYRALRADEQYKKEVAIKLVRAGRDSSLFLRRFRNERQILASLDHPNIARLLDGGTTQEGDPYLVMELIEGQPINEYCDQRKLTISARLKIFLEVCSAVQYAHSRLIVHRDIKPSNVLVTAQGIPKLLDFGIAKILDPSDGTEGVEATLTLRMLTPAYASPEQIRAEPITTASDVYSLAVVLYQLLTGRLPYDVTTRTPEGMLRAVLETEAGKPSGTVGRAEAEAAARGGKGSSAAVSAMRGTTPERLRRRLRGDLDNIVLMALRKEPRRRYGSVEGLAQDISRHLESLPVVARKDTVGYRASKFITRHKAAVVAALVVLAALIGGLGSTLREAHIAQRRFNEVRELANSLVFDIHDSIKDLPGATHARQVLVQKASEYLDRLERESGNDPSLQREVANAYERLGSVQGEALSANLGDSAEALQSYRKAEDIEERLSVLGVTQDRLRYAKTERAIAKILWATSDTANALKSAQKCLAITQALAKKEPSNQEVLVELAAGYVLVGDLMTTTYGNSSAPESTNEVIEDAYRRAVELDNKLASGSTDPQRRRSLAVDDLYIGRHFNDAGRWQEAAAAFSEALAIIEGTAATSNNKPQVQRDLAAIHNNLGDCFLMSGNASHALPEYEEALRLVSANALADPSDSDAQSLVAEAELNVGNALRKIGKKSNALDHLGAATVSLAKTARKDPKNQAVQRDLAIGYLWSARTLANGGDFARALEDHKKAITTVKELVRADSADLDNQVVLAGTFAAMGDFLQKRAQMPAADENYRQAISAGESLLAKAPDKGEMRYVLAQAYLGLGQVQISQAARESAPLEEQVSHWRQAKSWIQHSSDAFHNIPHPAAVTTNGLDALDAGEIGRAMFRCDTALAKLRPPRQH